MPQQQRVVLVEGVRSGVVLGACAAVLAVLGLTPTLAWIPEVPLFATGLLLPVAVLAVTGYRAGGRSGRIQSGALAGSIAGVLGGAVGGLMYVLFDKPVVNVPVGLLLGAVAGAGVGAIGAWLALRRGG